MFFLMKRHFGEVNKERHKYFNKHLKIKAITVFQLLLKLKVEVDGKKAPVYSI